MLAAVSGFHPRVACRSSGYRFMSALAGAGAGVALLPSLALTGRPDVRDLRIALGPNRKGPWSMSGQRITHGLRSGGGRP
jgi:DNA-binding transcriptional LysR family regulator